MTAGECYRRLLDDVKQCAIQAGRRPEEVAVIAVSKTYPADAVVDVYDAGCRDFGESRVQEAMPKMAQCPPDIRWHLIGTLQKNKVNKVVGQFALIHSVDSVELAIALSRASVNHGTIIQVLLQVNTSGELSKHGLSPDQWRKVMHDVLKLPAIHVQGLMTMAPLTDEAAVVSHCFADLRRYKESIEQEFSITLPHLSMGMSHDYPIAVAEGATLLRIGTTIFGEKSG